MITITICYYWRNYLGVRLIIIRAFQIVFTRATTICSITWISSAMFRYRPKYELLSLMIMAVSRTEPNYSNGLKYKPSWTFCCEMSACEISQLSAPLGERSILPQAEKIYHANKQGAPSSECPGFRTVPSDMVSTRPESPEPWYSKPRKESQHCRELRLTKYISCKER